MTEGAVEKNAAQPRLCVGAVVFRGDAVLLIRRGAAPFAAAWSLPGGGVEFGERLEDAILREIREETAIACRLLGLLGVYELLPDPPRQTRHYVLVDYVAEWVGGEPAAGDDAVDAGFVPVEEAIALVSWDETRAAIRLASERRKEARAAQIRL